MTDTERAEAEALLAKVVHRQAAEWLTLVIGLAAELYPDILREALGKVFDLKLVEADARKAHANAQAAREAAWRIASEIQALTGSVEQTAQSMEGWLDRIHYKAETVVKLLAAARAATNGGTYGT